MPFPGEGREIFEEHRMHVTLTEAAQLLSKGKVVVFPTETVYGLGACADNPRAVETIYEVKRRPRDNPLICHFYSVVQIERYGIVLTSVAQALFSEFSPGPLSLLLDLPPNSPLAPATGGRPTIICRIPNHPVALDLLHLVDVPIAAPSANTSGRMSGTQLDMIEHDLGGRVAGYLDGGAAVIGIESTIVDARRNDQISILRPGVIGKPELTMVLLEALKEGKISALPTIVERAEAETPTPGTRYAHYAPRTVLMGRESNEWGNEKDSVLAYIATDEWLRERGVEPGFGPIQHAGVWYLALGSRHDLLNIARRLYYALYQLDQLALPKACFIAEEWGQTSVGRALHDRIQKILAAH